MQRIGDKANSSKANNKKVRWREIITNMINDGVERFIEIGPGNVLTNLVKRMSKEITSISISKVDDFEKLDNI